MQHLHYSAWGSFGSVLLTTLFAFVAIAYVREWRNLRTTPVSVSGSRAFSFLGGLFLIWIATASGLVTLDHELLTVHMLKHLLLMTVAPPLIWFGEPVRALMRGLPHNSQRVFQRPVLQKIGHFLGQPQVCWLAATAALILWH